MVGQLSEVFFFCTAFCGDEGRRGSLGVDLVSALLVAIYFPVISLGGGHGVLAVETRMEGRRMEGSKDFGVGVQVARGHGVGELSAGLFTGGSSLGGSFRLGRKAVVGGRTSDLVSCCREVYCRVPMSVRRYAVRSVVTCVRTSGGECGMVSFVRFTRS